MDLTRWAPLDLARWDPFRDLEETSTRLNRFFGLPATRQPGDDGLSLANWAPAVDVQETESEYLVIADLPDVKKTDVKVAIEDSVLCLSGSRKQELEDTGKHFRRVERAYGRFERRLALPAEVDRDKVKAEFSEGVLRVHLPKSPTTQPAAVEVPVA